MTVDRDGSGLRVGTAFIVDQVIGRKMVAAHIYTATPEDILRSVCFHKLPLNEP